MPPSGRRRHDQLEGKSVIASVEAIIISDRRLTVDEMSEELDIPHSTFHRILTEDLRPSKKAARWVPKLLDEGMKKKRIEASEVFVNHAGGLPEVFLSKIITMDDTMVSFYNPETKEQSKQWLRKESLAPTKAKSQASRKKQMVFAFFDDSGSVYEHYASVGTKINGDYIIEVLRKFLRILPRKRPLLAEEGGSFIGTTCRSTLKSPSRLSVPVGGSRSCLTLRILWIWLRPTSGSSQKSRQPLLESGSTPTVSGQSGNGSSEASQRKTSPEPTEAGYRGTLSIFRSEETI